MQWLPDNRSSLYGYGAFAGVVVASYADLAFNNRLGGEPWQVPVVFALGAAYMTLNVACDRLTAGRPAVWLRAYYAVQIAIVLAAIWLSPARGFFGILGLPLVSQAIFDYGWRGLPTVGALVYGGTVAVWFPAFGWSGVMRGVQSFAPGYIFTIAFSFISRQALLAREQSEKLAAELGAANAQLRAHAAATAELATTRERNRLAREIHDGVGHYLTTIKVQLDAAQALFAVDAARAADSVAKAARLAGEALDDVRRSVGSLAADAARPPLPDVLRKLAADVQPAPDLRIEGAPRGLPAATEHALYRAAQEGLTNVSKHAAASASAVVLDFRDPARVRLTVLDNGRGAAAGGDRAAGGYGLRGLGERLALLGGTLRTGPRPDGGFSLEVEVPA
ncbi:MAG: hypothetical protein B9S34_04695 [Opitutia bacterium Tous-C1TDCM]|nr:MAG: hypothetical protein B9S34_04695 [Opitutae bacterium Tous-C1TDCM]